MKNIDDKIHKLTEFQKNEIKEWVDDCEEGDDYLLVQSFNTALIKMYNGLIDIKKGD